MLMYTVKSYNNWDEIHCEEHDMIWKRKKALNVNLTSTFSRYGCLLSHILPYITTKKNYRFKIIISPAN